MARRVGILNYTIRHGIFRYGASAWSRVFLLSISFPGRNIFSSQISLGIRTVSAWLGADEPEAEIFPSDWRSRGGIASEWSVERIA